jgi:hypothetical protein
VAALFLDQPVLSCTVIPGRRAGIEPEISRARARVFDAPRDDGENPIRHREEQRDEAILLCQG